MGIPKASTIDPRAACTMRDRKGPRNDAIPDHEKAIRELRPSSIWRRLVPLAMIFLAATHLQLAHTSEEN